MPPKPANAVPSSPLRMTQQTRCEHPLLFFSFCAVLQARGFRQNQGTNFGEVDRVRRRHELLAGGSSVPSSMMGNNS